MPALARQLLPRHAGGHARRAEKGSETLSRRILRIVISTTSASVYRSRMSAMALRTSTISIRSPQWASSGQVQGS